MAESHKVCRKCKRDLPIKYFSTKQKDGKPLACCKECRAERQRIYAEAHIKPPQRPSMGKGHNETCPHCGRISRGYIVAENHQRLCPQNPANMRLWIKLLRENDVRGGFIMTPGAYDKMRVYYGETLPYACTLRGFFGGWDTVARFVGLRPRSEYEKDFSDYDKPDDNLVTVEELDLAIHSEGLPVCSVRETKNAVHYVLR